MGDDRGVEGGNGNRACLGIIFGEIDIIAPESGA